MTALELEKIDHIAIPVKDIARASNWYQQQFSCKVLYQDETWAFLEFANIRLALVLPQQHPPHLAFSRDDAEKFGELKTHRDGSKSVYIKDSEGNSVEILDAESMKDLFKGPS